MEFQVIGKSIPRHDVLLQVTGKLTYADDIVLPNMLFAKALRSKYPHARLLAVDVSKATRMPGVKGIITARDFVANRWGFTHLDQPALVDDKVRYIGDPIAVVAATSPDEAEEAVNEIRVDYEELPAVFDPFEAMKPDSPKIHGDSNVATHLKIRRGDVEQGFRESDLVIEETYKTQMVEHAHIEPHAAVAQADPTGKVTVWSSVQRPFLVAADLARLLGLPMNRVRVVATPVGGGFGGKNEITVEPFVALLAMKTQRPVKMVYTREEEFQASTVRHPYVMTYRSGVKKDGTIVARHIRIVSDSGAYVSWGESTLTKASVHAAGPYRIPNVWVDSFLVYTNNPVGGAMRGFGVPQVAFAYECHTDTLARELGMDPYDFRMKNIIVDGSSMPTGQVLTGVALPEILETCAERSGWRSKR